MKMKNWFNNLFKRRKHISDRLKKNLKSDLNESTEKLVEKLKEDNDRKDEEIHNLLIDIMLLENDIDNLV